MKSERTYSVYCLFFSLIVCTNITTSNADSQPCSRFNFEGYLCTPRENCADDGYLVDDTINEEQIRTGLRRKIHNSGFEPSAYYCNLDTEICCRNSSFYGIPEPIIRDLEEFQFSCSSYAKHGYKCVNEDECADDGYTFTDSLDGRLGIRTNSASSLTCDSIRQGFSSSQVCCRDSKFFGSPVPPGAYTCNYCFPASRPHYNMYACWICTVKTNSFYYLCRVGRFAT